MAPFPGRHFPAALKLTLILLLPCYGALASEGANDPGFRIPQAVRTGVFGDGETQDGVGDDRIPLGSDAWSAQRFGSWAMSGGTLECDGRQRGSAMLVDVGDIAPGIDGAVLLTAAHVLVDLESGEQYRACRFVYMGLAQLPGYQPQVDLSLVTRGGFDPASDRSDPGFGRGDWAWLYVPGPLPAPLMGAGVRPLSYDRLGASLGEKVGFHLLAWDQEAQAISVSPDCKVVVSVNGDLGGGVWRGQLLDDCDSGQGASGGGLLAQSGRGVFLVGVRSGSHWDPERFPEGPPDGAGWDVETYTNFSRAVDDDLLSALSRLLDGLARRL